ncbi:hypothetical protein ALC62_14601 [Cyphomyrmex costatus]|uniref:Uncharacterized protein n=1 Tax=Cyphomyrmex costatus TaxID=456900 RepID=A0A151I8K3_9HYME|nr:hypothetical protein ALC62_14601 [Cyphomyrmex costatus]
MTHSLSQVLLFPEEGWARSASSSYWTLTPFWWSRSRCKVVEVAGTRRYSTQAKMVDTGTGTLYIIGSFKRMTIDPDFKVHIIKFTKYFLYNFFKSRAFSANKLKNPGSRMSVPVARPYELIRSHNGRICNFDGELACIKDCRHGQRHTLNRQTRACPGSNDLPLKFVGLRPKKTAGNSSGVSCVLYLTSNVSSSDFNMGYSMTGTLERGCKKTNSFQMTHFAVIRRRDYEKAYEDPNPT